MAFRGRGRGRGRGFGGGGGFGFAVEKPFELFPEVELPDRKMVPVETNLILWNSRLLNYWKSSPYHLEETVEKKSQTTDIERYCDWKKLKTSSTRDSIYQFLQINSSNFPDELVKDSRQRQSLKRVRWNPAQQKLDDYFDKIEQKFQDQGEKDGMEKKEEEDEEEIDEEAVEAEEEYSDDGDYNQNRDFDDDDDDYNMEEGDDEPTY